MLILSRKVGDEIVIMPGTDEEVRIVVTECGQNHVRIGFDAQPHVVIMRREIMCQEDQR